MKNQIIITALALGAIVFGTNNVMAQTNEAGTVVNITLADVISIDQTLSAAAGGEVNFKYETAEDYNQIQTWNVPNSLVVTSTKKFDIVVKAGGANFEKGSDVIPVDVLWIKPVVGGTTNMGGTHTAVNLTATDQKLVQGAPLGSKVVLELDYEIPAAKSSSADILGKPAGTYSQKVIYTATAL